MTIPKIPVGIVDDKSQNRLLFTERLNFSEEIAVVMTAADGKDFLDQMKRMDFPQRPAVILMDVEMAEMDGIAAVQAGKILYPDVRFLMLTVFDDDDKIFEAIKAGADGYLLKNEKISTIIDCIVQLSESGSAPMSPRIARKTLDLLMKASIPKMEEGNKERHDYELSDRETEILKLTIDGYSYRQIAERLFLSGNTIKKHLANIYHKLHVTSKAQAIKIATRNRLI
ncbi:MAG: response regulator transcription factor [Bacteroidota bacterium]|nr:response regulator transcription factor [Bacteroidota bacterium]MDP4247633.1 response regulator transcription factor [Bacteroidota bacterium]MDP4253786.1 response regulator transcription factor [Bacteroidota bacterium]MDP4257696.1 response regulator transcription factor [Bacteroidota bacterium]